MFLLYHSEGCNICEMVLHECYVNDLHTTTCSGMLGHHSVSVYRGWLVVDGTMMSTWGGVPIKHASQIYAFIAKLRYQTSSLVYFLQ
jgi:hypothetical protein